MFKNTLRKAIASVSTTALLMSSVIVPGMGLNVAQAQVDHWAYDMCKTLVDEGLELLGDLSSDCTNLNGNASRGLSAAINLHVGFLADGAEIATEQAAAETANGLGYLQGENNDPNNLNAKGNLNRASNFQMGINFNPSLEGLPSDGMSFPDIPSGIWYEGPMNALYRVGAANGINGEARGGQFVTIAEAIATAAQSYYAASVVDEANSRGEALPSRTQIIGNNGYNRAVDFYNGVVDVDVAFSGGPIVGGNLNIVLSNGSPLDILSDNTIAELGKIDVTGTGYVESITFTTGGLSSDDDLGDAWAEFMSPSGLRVYDDNGDVPVIDNTVRLPIRRPAPFTAYIVLEVEDSFNQGTLNLSINSVNDVETNGATVNGNFPQSTRTYQFVDGTNNTGQLFVELQTISGTQTETDAGEPTENTRFKFTAGNKERVNLERVALDQAGTIDIEDIESVVPLNVFTGEEGEPCSIDLAGDTAFCLLGMLLEEGQTTDYIFRTITKIDAETGGETIKWQLKESRSVAARGNSTGQRLNPTAQGTDPNFPMGDAAGVNETQVRNGSKTVSRDSTSRQGEAEKGSTDVAFATFGVDFFGESQEDESVLIQQTGTALATDFKSNFKVVMHDRGQDPQSGVTMATIDSQDAAIFGAGKTQTTTRRLHKPGESKLISILGSLASGATDGRNINFSFQYTTETVNTDVTTTSGLIAGNTVTIQDSNVVAAINNGLANDTFIAGATGVELCSGQLESDNEAIDVSTIQIGFTGAAGTAINMILRRMDLENNPQVGTSKPTAIATQTFSSNATTKRVDAGKTGIYSVFVDFTTAASGNYSCFFPANGFTFTGTETLNSRQTPTAQVNLQTMAVGAVGSIVARRNTPSSAAVIGTNATAMVNSTQVEAAFEGFVTEAVLYRVENATNNIATAELLRDDVVVATASEVNNYFRFPYASTLTKDAENSLELRIKATGDSTMKPGDNITAYFVGIEGNGLASGLETAPSGDGNDIVGTATTAARLGLNVNDLLVRDTGGVAATDVVTQAFAYESDYTATGPQLSGTATPVAAGTRIGTLGYGANNPTANTLTVAAATTGNANEDFALHELVAVYDVSAGTTRLGVVSAAATDIINASVLNVHFVGDAASTAFAAATGDVILHLATALNGDLAIADVSTTLGFSVADGQIAFVVNGGTARLAVITDTLAAGGDGDPAGAVINGVDLADADGLVTFASAASFTPNTFNTQHISPGIAVFTDADTVANNGLRFVNTSSRQGENSTVAGAVFTGVTLAAGAAGDRIAFLNESMSGESYETQIAYPAVTITSEGVSGIVAKADEVFATIELSNNGTRQLSVSALGGTTVNGPGIKCVGSYLVAAGGAELGAIRLLVDGTREIAITDAGGDCNNGRTLNFNAPETITAGGKLKIQFRYNSAGGPAGTNLTAAFQFDGLKGGPSFVSTFYTVPQGNPNSASAPTLANPNRNTNFSRQTSITKET